MVLLEGTGFRPEIVALTVSAPHTLQCLEGSGGRLASGRWFSDVDVRPAQAAPGSQGRLCPFCLLSCKLAITFPALQARPFLGELLQSSH